MTIVNRKFLAALAAVWLTAASLLPGDPAAATPPPAGPPPARQLQQATPPTPLLAYYYAWFDPTSWNRAKIDYPELGRYSSDDPRVMRQQIEWAKAAGIGGFVVSWKDTPTNTRRLRLLMSVAKETDFKLAMIYQGLDFDRKPQPVDRVVADFAMFREQFAADPVFFRLGGKPLTIFSGTWEFSHDAVAKVTGPVRKDMLVLSTEKSTDGYQRIADVTDGDAYYWSSVNPDTYGDPSVKLSDMSKAIHQDGKYWVAPFAPGFDARLVGGAKAVDRKDGETMRIQYSAAVKSSPDVLGLISWNEFSENSYVEPSQNYGHRYLDVLTELRQGAVTPTASTVPGSSPPLDSSSGDEGLGGPPSVGGYLPNILVLAGFPVLLVVVVGIASWRQRRRTRHRVQPDPDDVETRGRQKVRSPD